MTHCARRRVVPTVGIWTCIFVLSYTPAERSILFDEVPSSADFNLRSCRERGANLLLFLYIDLKVTVEGFGVPILSRHGLSESPSCWHLRVRVTLTPERPTSTSSSGYPGREHHDSCIVHFKFLHPAHQIQAHTSTKADIAKGHGYGPSGP